MKWNITYSRGSGRGSVFLVVDDSSNPASDADTFLVYESIDGASYLKAVRCSHEAAVEWVRHAVASIRIGLEGAAAGEHGW